MRLLIQRVSRAKVSVEERVTAEIGPGLLIFLGIGFDDSESICAEMARKASRLRIFADESGKMNLDIMQVSGEVIVVSPKRE